MIIIVVFVVLVSILILVGLFFLKIDVINLLYGWCLYLVLTDCRILVK